MQIFIVDAFTSKEFSGNPAGVVNPSRWKHKFKLY